MTPDQVLDRAANLLDERGHCKGSFTSPGGARCAIGALNDCVRLGWFLAAEALAEAIVPGCNGDTGGVIAAWNDAPERTKDEVTSTMRAVAATLRAQRGSETPTVTDGRSVETRQDEVVCAP